MAYSKLPFEHGLRATWANLPTPSDAGAGTIALATDIGESGTHVQSNGTHWRVARPTEIVFTNGAALGTYSSTLTGLDQILLSVTLPVGILRAGRSFGVRAVFGRAGSTDDATSVTVRLGTAGTTADAAILSSALLVKETSTLALEQRYILTSATNVRQLGPFTGVASTTAYPVDVTISSADSAVLKLSAGIDLAGTTDLGYLHNLHLTLYP